MQTRELTESTDTKTDVDQDWTTVLESDSEGLARIDSRDADALEFQIRNGALEC